ncbi:hypothetical protein E2C01_039395 [Portunus trituberculatus]|uniref:Uncharacterized protein n=1 Tax=Portunus trituberculatus TaxID=210409 RepID=A0A5B7FKN1_PORTR|nr:hypothetical protein [Portunus trituberculatus]
MPAGSGASRLYLHYNYQDKYFPQHYSLSASTMSYITVNDNGSARRIHHVSTLQRHPGAPHPPAHTTSSPAKTKAVQYPPARMEQEAADPSTHKQKIPTSVINVAKLTKMLN